MSCSYNPLLNSLSNHLAVMWKSFDLCISHYDNIMLTGDFNSEVEDVCTQSLCAAYELKSLIKKPACNKNPDKPSCVDLITTKFSKVLCYRDWSI